MASSFGRDPDSRAFLQTRVCLFALAAAGLGGFFLAFRISYALIGGFMQELASPSLHLHGAAVAAFVALWVALRRGERSFELIRRAEELALFGGCTLYSIMGTYIPPLGRPESIVTAALTYMLVSRAIYVPSTTRRTLALTGAMIVPLLTATYLAYDDLSPLYLQAASEAWQLDLEPQAAIQSRLIETTVWWILTTATAALASWVIFGLRREVYDARKLGQYTLERKLGEGGMGMVYCASHAMLRRPTAVKLLPVDKTSAESVARFEREVQRTAELTHPNTVTIFDYGRTPDGVFYYAMELLDGASVETVVDRYGPMEPARVAHVLAHVASALTEAHGVGLIHRDIKPANIVLCAQGGVPDVPKVLDFGLVKELDRAGDASLTGIDTITGTPNYLSPEAITSPDSVDARSDIYALGAVGYFMLTGQQVFDGASVVEVCSHHLHTAPVPPAERLGAPVNPDLAEVVLACLQKAPADRPQTSLELERRVLACNAGAWTVDDARKWWEHRASALQLAQTAPPSATAQTIAVDLGRRLRE